MTAVNMTRHYASKHAGVEYPASAIAEARFHAATKPGANGCIEWAAGRDRDGYGVFHLGKSLRAHRWIYEHVVGAIPEGFVIDHLCRNRACVNPEHLEPVENRENLMRGETRARRNAEKVECPQGHPYSGDNLYVSPTGGRACKTCRLENLRRFQSDRERANAYRREWRARRKAAK
ncbi:HNH endonuclease [Mycobacterium phage Superphikiman]|nr:HNH endonuclease [Mycobacterium phage Superphikiman]